MQAAINPALQAAMTLDQAAQVGEFRPTTPQGAPTVAAQLMQKAIQPPQPTLPQMAQQAGLGAQIQGMQQQQAQQALMQQAMQQRAQQQPAGIAGLNPNVGGFADGGIVGYAAAGETRDAEERYVPSSEDIRAMFGRAGYEDPIPSEDVMSPYERSQALGEEAIRRAAAREITPEQTRQSYESRQAQLADVMKAQGLDPAFMRAAAEEATRRGQEQADYYAAQAKAAKEQQQATGLRDFLLGARGASFADTMRGGAASAIAAEKAAQAQVQNLMEMKFQIQNTAAKERNLLDQARHKTMVGDYDGAQKALQDAETLRQQREINTANYYKAQAAELGRGQRAAEKAETWRDITEMKGQTARDVAETRAEATKEAARTRATRGAEGAKAPYVRSTKTDAEGNIIAFMSDGTQKNTGVKSFEFNARVANIIQKQGADSPSFRKLPPEEQRRLATEILIGTPGAAPSETPVPAKVSRPTTQAEFDALPKGARYVNPSDGKEYTKN